MATNHTIRDVALYVIEASPDYFDESFLGLIPEQMLSTVIANDKYREISEMIDSQLFFPAQYEFAKAIDLPEGWGETKKGKKEWYKAANSRAGSLTSAQEEVRKKMRFFGCVSRMIAQAGIAQDLAARLS